MGLDQQQKVAWRLMCHVALKYANPLWIFAQYEIRKAVVVLRADNRDA